MDEDGFVSIVGRSKDTIIRGGENISPSEVEFFLATHPDIEEVHVFGAPDEVLGEKVAAWVKMRPAAQDRPVTLESLASFCKGKIAHFKVPAELRIVDSFPLTITGKVMKYKMREAYAKKK
jgi:fatty-acyl-CoA synthase